MRMPFLFRSLLGIVLVATGCNSSSSDSNVSDSSGGNAGNDGGNGTTCMTMHGCGGDVVGNWMITASCLDFTLDLAATCPGLTAAGSTTNTGSVTYRADLTYQLTFSVSGTVRYYYPSACLSMRTCAEHQAYLMQAGLPMATSFTATCQSSAGGCVCDIASVTSPAVENGTYSVSAGVLTTVHDGTSDRSNYCVTGDVMQQMPLVRDTIGGTLAGTITMSRL